MAPTKAAFVHAVMDHLGLSQTDLGIALRKGNAYQTVHGWLGRKKLGYDDTMAMLELCGWLNMDAEAPTKPARANHEDGHQEEIAAALRDIAAAQEEILRRLPPADAQAPPRARPTR